MKRFLILAGLATSVFSHPLRGDEQSDLVRVVEQVSGAMPDGRLHFAQKPCSETSNCISADGINFTDRQTYDLSRARSKDGLRHEISEEEASRLFEFLKSQQDIPVYYFEDGCYARAHAMARLLELNGIYSRKMFLSGPGNLSLLLVSSDLFPVPRPVRYEFHVAPLISVRKKDGSVEDVIIDPTFEVAPVPVNQWQSHFRNCTIPDPAQRNAQCLVSVRERFAYKPGAAAQDSWSPADWADAEMRNSMKGPQQASQARAAALKARMGTRMGLRPGQ